MIGFFIRNIREMLGRKKRQRAFLATEEVSPKMQEFEKAFNDLDGLMSRVSSVCQKTEEKFQQLLTKKVREAEGQKEKDWPKVFFDALDEARNKAVTVDGKQVVLFPSDGFEDNGNILNRTVLYAEEIVLSQDASAATKVVALCETVEALEEVLNVRSEKLAFMDSHEQSFSVIRHGIYEIESCAVLLDNDMRWQLSTLSVHLDLYLKDNTDNNEFWQKSSMDMKALGNACDRYIESLKRMEQLLDCGALRFPKFVCTFALNITRQDRFSLQEKSKSDIKEGIERLITTLQKVSERAKQAAAPDLFEKYN
jgi:hypothetical protein